MTASEKLRALVEGLPRERIEERIRRNGWNPDWATPQKLEEVSREIRLEAYDAALPLIADCIEADEIGWKAHDVPNCEYCGAPTLDARSRILGSLAALREHLEGGDDT